MATSGSSAGVCSGLSRLPRLGRAAGPAVAVAAREAAEQVGERLQLVARESLLDTFEAVLADGTLSGSAEVASIKVQDENLSGHLLSPDFFDAERFPRVSFTSTELRREGDELIVDGELEIRGARKPVRLTGTIAGPVGERIGISLETEIDRTDFGISWNMELPGGGPALENEVKLTADLELVRA